jgi:hypothetical protein
MPISSIEKRVVKRPITWRRRWQSASSTTFARADAAHYAREGRGVTDADRALRCAVYSRVSTDKQSADSPADQVTRGREFATSRGWDVVSDLVIEGSVGRLPPRAPAVP